MERHQEPSWGLACSTETKNGRALQEVMTKSGVSFLFKIYFYLF